MPYARLKWLLYVIHGLTRCHRLCFIALILRLDDLLEACRRRELDWLEVFTGTARWIVPQVYVEIARSSTSPRRRVLLIVVHIGVCFHCLGIN